jgi:predicted ATPase
VGAILRGWALAMQGQGEEGLAQLRQGLAAWRAMGAGLTVSYYLALLAETLAHVDTRRVKILERALPPVVTIART